MALLLSWLALLGPCRRHGAPSSHTSSRTRVVVATPWHPRGEARGQGGSEEPVLLFVGLLIFCPLALNFSAQWVLIFLLALQRVLFSGSRVRSLDTSQESRPTCESPTALKSASAGAASWTTRPAEGWASSFRVVCWEPSGKPKRESNRCKRQQSRSEGSSKPPMAPTAGSVVS